MEWRIRKSLCGFCAEKGMKPRNAFVMSDFIVYESVRFDTEKEAKRYVNLHTKAAQRREGATR